MNYLTNLRGAEGRLTFCPAKERKVMKTRKDQQKKQSRSDWQKIVDDAGFKGAQIIETHSVEVQNRFGGNSIMLNPAEQVIYDVISGAEMHHQYKLVQRGIDWFIKNNIEAYSILLD